jgi:tetratricopeptide (TPR) repeat protein
MHRKLNIAGFALAVFLPLTPCAAEVSDASKYANCMDLAVRDAEAAFDAATAWQNLGGGDPARHCAAVALFNIGHFEDAAKRFEMLAIKSGLSPALRAQAMAQAGQAWLQADEPEKADGALSDAIVVLPRDASIWIDRSVVRASVADYDRAILDLTQALRLDPDRVEALTLRAAANRLSGRMRAALEDINAAIARAPDNPEALLERGILREAGGDRDGARRDWIQVLTITPESPTGQAARNHIELMDVTGRQPG